MKPISPTTIAIRHNVASQQEVNEIMAAGPRAGAIVIKSTQDTFYGGYAGYFRNPDGHLWEII